MDEIYADNVHVNMFLNSLSVDVLISIAERFCKGN